MWWYARVDDPTYRLVRPRRAVDIHDGLLSDLAVPVYGRMLGPEGRPGLGGAEHLRLTPGESVAL